MIKKEVFQHVARLIIIIAFIHFKFFIVIVSATFEVELFLFLFCFHFEKIIVFYENFLAVLLIIANFLHLIFVPSRFEYYYHLVDRFFLFLSSCLNLFLSKYIKRHLEFHTLNEFKLTLFLKINMKRDLTNNFQIIFLHFF